MSQRVSHLAFIQSEGKIVITGQEARDVFAKLQTGEIKSNSLIPTVAIFESDDDDSTDERPVFINMINVQLVLPFMEDI